MSNLLFNGSREDSRLEVFGFLNWTAGLHDLREPLRP